MNTDQKLLQIVDKLLVKTQDNLCTWRKNTENKFTLQTTTASIVIYYNQIIGGTSSIVLEINRDHLTLISISQDLKNINSNSNLIRLYNIVTEYYENYVDEFINDILIDLQKK